MSAKLYMGVCRDCAWNGRKRKDGREAVEDGARHNYTTDHTWNVLEAPSGTRADGYGRTTYNGWRATRDY